MPDGGQFCPALVLNADFRPLSYFPLSLWSWQDAVKAVFLDRVSVLSEYEIRVHSPSLTMKLPACRAYAIHCETRPGETSRRAANCPFETIAPMSRHPR